MVATQPSVSGPDSIQIDNGVNRSEIERFTRDGAIHLPGRISPEWLELLALGVEYNQQNPSKWAHGFSAEVPDDEPDSSSRVVGFWSDYVTWPKVPEYQSVIFESGLAELAGQLMESSEVRLFHEHVLVKEPGTTSRTPWHHDQPYYCVDGDQNISFWIALDPVPKGSGLRFIAGSHRWGRWFVPRRFADHVPYVEASIDAGGSDAGRLDADGDGDTGGGRAFELVPDLDAELDQHQVLTWDVEPGDIVAFHFRTLHDAPGNKLASRRRAVSLRWLGDDATFAQRPWEASPPFEQLGLVVGGSLQGDDRFPLITTSSSILSH